MFVSLCSQCWRIAAAELTWYAHFKMGKPPSATCKRWCSTQKRQRSTSLMCAYPTLLFILNAFLARGHKLLGSVYVLNTPPPVFVPLPSFLSSPSFLTLGREQVKCVHDFLLVKRPEHLLCPQKIRVASPCVQCHPCLLFLVCVLAEENARQMWSERLLQERIIWCRRQQKGSVLLSAQEERHDECQE